MKKVEQVVKSDGTPSGLFQFYCPGCEMHHQINTNPIYGPVWEFNDDLEKPTASPSLLVTFPTSNGNRKCHSYIKNGFIQFLSDCSHVLAGQTIEIPNVD